MTDQDRLFEAVLSNPDDDTPRLVYADFLDEQGGIEHSIRAKFIRAACELARVSWDDPARDRLARLCEQYQARVSRWDAERQPPFVPHRYQRMADIGYDRGLPVLGITVDRADPDRPLPDLPPGWAAAVRVYGSGDERDTLDRITARVAGWPFAGRVVAGTVGGNVLRPADLVAACGAVFPRLTGLTVFAPAVRDGDVAAMSAQHLPLLRELHLAGGDGLSTDGLSELLHGPLCRAIRVLTIDIGQNPRDQFPDLADQLHTWPEPFQQVGWGGYNVPLPGRPPLRLLFDDGIPF